MHNILFHLGAAFLWTLVILAYVTALCAVVGETKREGQIRALRQERNAQINDDQEGRSKP